MTTLRTSAWAVILALGALLGPLPPASAQSSLNVEIYDLEAPQERIDVPIAGARDVVITFHDRSVDSGAAAGQPTGAPHRIHTHVEGLPPQLGWTVSALPLAFDSFGGQSRDIIVRFQVDPVAEDIFFKANLTVTATNILNEERAISTTLLAYTPGLAAFNVQVAEAYVLKPNRIVDVPVRISNTALTPRTFDMAVAENPCGLAVALTQANVVGPKSTSVVRASVETPDDKLWFRYDDCQITFQVTPTDNAGQVRTAIVSIQVAGFYVDPVWVFWLVALVAAAVLLALLVVRRKARIEEEILGKPQKPWTIPVEKLYLRKLKGKDPRAWYVVRHYLMDEEYRSALLWYSDYKRSTRGDRKKERLILSQEKAYEAWRRKWARRIQEPLKRADRLEARLQKGLDRRADAVHRQKVRKAAALTARMRKAHEAQAAKAEERWRRQSGKAAKRGRPAPERPQVPAPDYPEAPRRVAVALADHRLARKAARFRRRMVRRQGNLEVRFEKADARRLQKVRRKVQRVARRLDDPAFVAEHPLLQGAGGAPTGPTRR